MQLPFFQNHKFKKNCRPCRHGETELFGLILLIVGLCAIFALILPSKLWLVFLGACMVFVGFKLFIS